MKIPIIGIVENMAYFKCPDCDKEYKIFGESHIDEIAQKLNIDILAKLPIDTRIATACDKGFIELFVGDWLENITNMLEKMEEKKNENCSGK